MIALDTNVLVRLILQDDAPQARAVERLLLRARRDQTPLFIADIVLCELVWVLSRRAHLRRVDIADALERLLDTELVVVRDAESAARALEGYRSGAGDFADYLIREQAAALDAHEVVTFDRSLRSEEGFRVIGG